MKATQLWSLAAVAGSLLAPLAQAGETNRYRPTTQPQVAQVRPVSNQSARPALLTTSAAGDVSKGPKQTAGGDEKTACCSPCFRPFYNACNPCYRTYYSSPIYSAPIVSPCAQPCYGGQSYYGGNSYYGSPYGYGGQSYYGSSFSGGGALYGGQPYGLPAYGPGIGQPFGPGLGQPIVQPYGGGGYYGPQPIVNPQPFPGPFGPQPGFGAAGPYGQQVVSPAVGDPLLQTIPVSGGYGPNSSPYYP